MPTALVVDDDPDLRSLMSAVLDRAGYQVWTESDGVTGLEAALRLRPDVALLDWLLPHRSGVEVCRAIRDQPTLDHTAVIMVSARSQDHDLEWGFSCGADDYVTKPFGAGDLLARIERSIERRTITA